MKGKMFFAFLIMLLSGMAVWAWAQERDEASRDSGYDTYQDQPDQEEGAEPAGEEGAVLPDEDNDPGREYIHVDVFPLGVEVGVPGFWRLRVRPGFAWVDGHMENDIFIPGFWRPKKSRGKDWAWVGGHWAGRHWIAGRWRQSFRRGYAWVEGHWDRNGEWLEGFWRPTESPKRGMTWEPGYWGPGGWVEGFWRPEARVGRLWVNGEWDQNGTWIKGHWRTAQRNDMWVHGYFDRHGNKVPGRVVKINDRKAPFTPGHYDRRGEWVEPRWGEQRAPERQDDRVPGENSRERRYDHEQDRSGGQIHQINGNDRENNQNQDRPRGNDQNSENRWNRGNDNRDMDKRNNDNRGSDNRDMEQSRDNRGSDNRNDNIRNTDNQQNAQPLKSEPQGRVHTPPLKRTPDTQNSDNSDVNVHSR